MSSQDGSEPGEFDGMFRKPNFERIARTSRGDIADEFAGTYDNLVDEIEVVHLKSGVSLADNKVIGYDMVRLLRGGLFQVSTPTFTKPFVIMQALLVLSSTLITMGFCLVLEQMEHFKIGDGALLATQASVTSVHTYFGGFLGFFFGYFVFDSLAASNGTKLQLSNFLGAVVSIVYLSHSFCPGAAGRDLEIKQTALRWAMATYSMMVPSLFYAILILLTAYSFSLSY
jgi:hypothetical protein